MADADRPPPHESDPFELDQRSLDRGVVSVVIEENVALCEGDPDATGQRPAHARPGGPRIDIDQPAPGNRFEHHRHPGAILGEPAAHVVVHPDRPRHAADCPGQAPFDLGSAEQHPQGHASGIFDR